MKRVFWLLLLAVAVIAVVACGVHLFRSSGADGRGYASRSSVDGGPQYPRNNVILISIDTLRADHLGCYGYSKNTTPNIDSFRRDAVLFKETIAQAPSTTPSHASLFTSLIPSHHGAFFSMKQPIRQGIPTMAEILRDHKYQTVSYNGGAQVAAEFGFDRGFDIYSSNVGQSPDSEKAFLAKVQAGIGWINRNPGNKFFLFLHTYEVHHPYTPKREHLGLFEKDYSGELPASIPVDLLRRINEGELKIDAADRDHIISAYDAEIYSVDESFGVLVNFLKQQNLYDDTIIIFTSDHGEEFGEHGMMGWHSHALYDEQLKVPLIVKFAGSRYVSEVIHQQVRSIDVLPTLLDALRIPIPGHCEGVSLLQWLRNSTAEELIAISEQDRPGKNRPISVRTKRHKLYGDRLFDLTADPSEQVNAAERNLEVCKRLRRELVNVLDMRLGSEEDSDVGLDQDTLKLLESLGYLE